MPDADSERKLDDHCRWELRELMHRLHPSDLTASEVIAMCAILAPAHSRKLAAARGHPGLRVVPPILEPGLDDATPDSPLPDPLDLPLPLYDAAAQLS